MRVAKTDGGKHRIVLPKIAVGCNVNDSATPTVGAQHGLGGLFSHECPGVRQHCAEFLNLGLNRGSLRVGYAEKERTPRGVRRLRLAERVYARARSIRNGKIVDQV